MFKLLALYRQPADPEAFERHYTTVHRPIVQSIPGLAKLVMNRCTSPPWGGESPYYLIAEMHFPDEQTFAAAMASPQNRAAGKDLRQFAGNIATLVTVREE
ncbi:MAG TPA: EthD family reductase [Steroidobacteraceae bacterium]